MHPFTKTEIYEALVERHTAAYQEKLDAGHVALQDWADLVPMLPSHWHALGWDICTSLILTV